MQFIQSEGSKLLSREKLYRIDIFCIRQNKTNVSLLKKNIRSKMFLSRFFRLCSKTLFAKEILKGNQISAVQIGFT